MKAKYIPLYNSENGV